jgi:hypothetical protein
VKKKISEIRIVDMYKDIPNAGFIKTSVTKLFCIKLNIKMDVESSYIVRVYGTADPEKHFNIDNDYPFLDILYYTNKDSFNNININDIQKHLLDVVHESFIALAENQSWNKEIIDEVYTDCIKANFVYEWYFKGKYFQSKDKKHYAAIKNRGQYMFFESWLIIYDKNKLPLSENLIFKERIDLFLVSQLKWIDNESVMFKFDGPKKEFVYSLRELEMHAVKEIPERIHLYFK